MDLEHERKLNLRECERRVRLWGNLAKYDGLTGPPSAAPSLQISGLRRHLPPRPVKIHQFDSRLAGEDDLSACIFQLSCKLARYSASAVGAEPTSTKLSNWSKKRNTN